MKSIRKIFQIGMIALGLVGAAKTTTAQTISNHFFGENAWMPDTIGNANACTEPPCLLYGKLHKNWDNIKNSGASLIRFGGIAADKNMPTNYQYIKMIDSIRAKGMEPVIQVPFANYRYTELQAADIVRFINVTKGMHVKYWIIGNEPDLGYHFTTASQVANYIRPFASAMKAVDPSILIVGPETAWYDQGVINGLTTPGGPDDITGKDAAGRYYIDVISFHSYPFNGTQTRADMITKLTSAGSLQDNLVSLNARIANCNAAHGRTGAATLKTAITEANVNWQNNGADNLNGVGANSFIGGQFLAEMLGISMKNGVDFVNIWSVVEGNNTALNIGYIDAQTGVKKPIYYHFKMMADNFKGNYADVTDNQNNVKTFASKSGSQINVMIMNQDLGSNFNYTVRLNSGTVSGSNALKIAVNAGVTVEYSDMIVAQGSVVLTFNSAGTLIKKTEYSLTGQAIANQPPVVTQYGTTGVEETALNVGTPNFDINVYPNPTAGKLTVAMNTSNEDQKSVEVEIVNLVGQLVYHKTLEFKDGKEMIDMQEGIANGVYIVRVKNADNKVVIKKIVLERK
ncbi:MAG: hypothetical protein JWO44_298 [Bacteroidetes bacterium]|nr:hypothetical protein [Bacteroidota bacterium]